MARLKRQAQWLEDMVRGAHEIGYPSIRSLCTDLCMLAATDWLAWAVLRNSVRRKLKQIHRQRLRERYPRE